MVSVYHLYLVQEDIAKTYFGREVLLFDLFTRFDRSRIQEEKQLLYKQIQYITKPLPGPQLHLHLGQALGPLAGYCREQDAHLVAHDGQMTAKLTLFPEYALLESNGSYEWETLFFEVLRKYEQSFLAMNYESGKYGWLNPIRKERKYV